jgi:hypothetical protein
MTVRLVDEAERIFGAGEDKNTTKKDDLMEES